MQRGFKLYIERPNSSKLITKFDLHNPSDSVNLFSTFDEKISFQEHDQINFTFSVMKYVDDATLQNQRAHNELLKLLTIGAKLRLVEDDIDEYDLIIKSVEPSLNKRNACYNFTCQDEASYRWSKLNLGYSYSTIDKGAPRNIYTIAQEILEECYLDHWDVVASNELSTATTTLAAQKITFEVSGSNPYNALIEACNAVNAQLSVNYRNKTISFFNKNNRPFSGYRYRPELNLSNLGASYNGENMATIMHVRGGTNEREINVSLVPYMPVAMQNTFLTRKDWETTEPTIGWYSNRIFPPQFRTTSEFKLADIQNAPAELPPKFIQRWETWSDYIDDVMKNCADTDTYNQHILELQDLYADFYLPYSVQEVEVVPDDLQKLYTLEEYNAHIKNEQATELREYKEFVQVANRQMHLGQFLINFDFFRNSGLLSSAAYDTLMNIFNIQMRDNNIWLKIYTQSHYELVWELNQKLVDLRNCLDQVTAMHSAIYDKGQDESITDMNGVFVEYSGQAQQHMNEAEKILGLSATGLHALIRSIYGNYRPANIPELADIMKEYESYKTMRDDAIVQQAAIEAKLLSGVGDYEKIQLESELQYYRSRYRTAVSLCGDGNANNEDGTWVIYGNCVVDSTYKMLIRMLIDEYVPASGSGTYNQIQKYEAKNAELWRTLYREYAQFIYEQNYENSDELDSLNLYNQAVSYYEDYNKPSASYTVETLDLGALEPISLPRVKVGYNIRVYNDYLNLNDNALNNIQFTNNELIIASIDYELRNSQKVSMSVEQITQYQTILQKLIKIAQ